MTVIIRPMSAADKPAVMQILLNTPEFKPFEVAVAEEVIDGCLADPAGSGYYTLVAVEDASVRGYITYGPTPLTEGTWDIYWEAVDREKRGRGTGRALMEAAEADIRQASGRLIVIETSSTPLYEGTLRFHLACGYGEIARIPDFYSPGDDKLLLQKRLR
ncbi:MAG TPA: GNAT family N-acetyltransferase [Dehalococcoidales bacterium]|nr:GNAT family N-acetyltransferase [Dehalococcoidales bacterium]